MLDGFGEGEFRIDSGSRFVDRFFQRVHCGVDTRRQRSKLFVGSHRNNLVQIPAGDLLQRVVHAVDAVNDDRLHQLRDNKKDDPEQEDIEDDQNGGAAIPRQVHLMTWQLPDDIVVSAFFESE